MTSGPIRVFSTAEQEENNKNIYAAGKPAHWVNAKGSSFVNPWPSFREHGFSDFVTVSISYLRQIENFYLSFFTPLSVLYIIFNISASTRGNLFISARELTHSSDGTSGNH